MAHGGRSGQGRDGKCRGNSKFFGIVVALLCAVLSTNAGASTRATGAPIKVGFLCSCSGTFGYIGVGMYDVYQAWVKTVNASGGINGHPVQVIYEDDAPNPSTAETDAQDVLSDGVVAIVDASALDSVWEKTVATAKVPVVGSTITSPPFYTNADFFTEGETNDSLVAAM